MSLPCASAPIPTATAHAAPPLDPPGVSVGSHGFRVAPYKSLSVNHRNENAGTLLRPMITAPAVLRLATEAESSLASASLNATTPFVVGWPARSALILVVIGTPSSGGNLPPRARRRSASSAAFRASTSSTSATALTRGFTSCRRCRQLRVASRDDTLPRRMASASCAVVQDQSGPDPRTAGFNAGLSPAGDAPAAVRTVATAAATAAAMLPRNIRRSISSPGGWVDKLV